MTVIIGRSSPKGTSLYADTLCMARPHQKFFESKIRFFDGILFAVSGWTDYADFFKAYLCDQGRPGEWNRDDWQYVARRFREHLVRDYRHGFEMLDGQMALIGATIMVATKVGLFCLESHGYVQEIPVDEYRIIGCGAPPAAAVMRLFDMLPNQPTPFSIHEQMRLAVQVAIDTHPDCGGVVESKSVPKETP